MILQPDRGEEATGRLQVATLRVLDQHVAEADVVVGIARHGFMQRRPRADIAPSGIERHDHAVLRFLHHCVIDGVAAAGTELPGGQTGEIQIALRRSERLRACLIDVRRQRPQLIQNGSCPEQEHAAVPVVLLRFDISGRRCEVRLFDELCNGIGRPVACCTPDVAVACFRLAGDDTEGHQLALLRCLAADLDRSPKRRNIADDMIGRQNEQQRVFIRPCLSTIAGHGSHRGNRHCRGRIASHRLEQNRHRLRTDLA